MKKALFALAALALSAAALAEVRLDSALTQHMQLSPGGVYKGTLTLSNPDDAPASATISLTDYRFAADGTSQLRTPPGRCPAQTPNGSPSTSRSSPSRQNPSWR